MFKKLCYFALIVSILLSLWGETFAQTDMDLMLPTTGEELLNGTGDFETDPSANWSAIGGWGGVYVKYVTDPLHASNHCVRIEDPGVGGKNPYIQKNITVIPGASYLLSAKLYSDQSDSNSGEAYFNLVFDKGGAERAGSFQGVTGDNWQSFTYNFTVPDEASLLQLAPRQKGQGYMYFDDIKLVMTDSPSALFVETDEVFYYTDHLEKGIATAEINTKAYPALSGKALNFYLKKENIVLEEELSVPTTQNIATFSFSVTEFVPKEEYYIEVQIAGIIDPRCTVVWKIYRYDRPTCLDAGGRYYRMAKNKETATLERTNEIINPVFAYRYRDYQFEIGKKNDINIAQLAMPQNRDGSYYSDEDTIQYLKNALDNAKSKGIMCMIALYRHGEPAGSAKNINVTEKVVKEFSEHEAVFAWMVMDETFSHFAKPFEDLRTSYITIRNIDPYHPVYICEATERLEEAGRYTDILCVDPYPAPYEDDSNIYSAAATFPGNRVALAVKAVKGKKPVYALLQAFRWEPDHANYFPTGDEMRNMLYQSLLAGASGVGYFKFDNADKTTDLNDTALWPHITTFSQNEQKNAFDAFVYKKYPIYTDVRKDDYWVVSFIKDESIYMLFMNRLKTEQTMSVSFAGEKNNAFVNYRFSSDCIAGCDAPSLNNTSSITCTLPKGGVALFRLIPQNAEMLANTDVFLCASCAQKGVDSNMLTLQTEIHNISDKPLNYIFSRYRNVSNRSDEIELDKFFFETILEKTASFKFEQPISEAPASAAKAFLWDTNMQPICQVNILN